jgi:uncharacterized membrane protein YgcG
VIRPLKWIVGVFAAIMLVGSVSFALTPSQAFAEDRCQPYVVDDANIFGAQKEAVAAAVKSLEDVGADGRVITIQSFGNAGSLDTYIDQMARGCPSWQMSGSLKQNFFALVISMQERKTTIYYGTQWKSRFDTQAAAIQSGVMAPLFKQGRYADGMIAAIESIKSTINAPAAPSGGNTVPQVEPTPTTPFNWGLMWMWVGGIFGGIVALGGLIALFVWVLLPWIRRRRESRELQHQAITLRDHADLSIRTLKTDLEKTDLITWFEDFAVVGGDALVQATASRSKAQNFLTEAQSEMDRAAKIGDPKLHLSDAKYLDLKSTYKSVMDSTDVADGHLKSLATQHEQLLTEANKLASQVEEFDSQLKGANTALLGLSQSGIDITSLSADIESAGQQVGQYHGLHDASALVLIAELPQLAKVVEKSIQAVTDCRTNLDTCASELAALQPLHQAAVDKRLPAQAAFERMSAQYAKGSWENIAGNGSKADKLLFRAKEMLDRVSSTPLTTLAQLESRGKSLAETRKLIEDGDDLLDAIIARESNIAEAQQTAPDEITRAENDIAKADEYLRQFSGDVDPRLSSALKKAREHLDTARRELASEQPNYLVVVKQALLANDAADEVHAQAVEQHEYLESVRSQLASARTLFATSSDKSERYIRNNRSDVDHKADRLLAKAKDAFALVAKQADEIAMLRMAKQALEFANSAYDSASDDVATAEAERREIERRAREAQEAEERAARRRREEEEERQRSYYQSSSSYSSSSSSSFGGFSSSSSFDSGSFGGSSGSSGW